MTKPYQFDEQLWLRFLRTAQPYFFPVAPRQTRVFLGLILALLPVILALIFFLTVGLTFLLPAIFPDFVSQFASKLIENIHGLLKSPAAYIAFGTLFIGSLLVVSQVPNLKGRWQQWLLLGLILSLLFATTGIKILTSYALNQTTTALNQRNEEAFWQSFVILGIIFLVAIPIYVIYNYSQQKLTILWREWLAKNLLELYFRQQSYYQHSINPTLDNPDQRITQDVDSFTRVTLNLLIEPIWDLGRGVRIRNKWDIRAA